MKKVIIFLILFLAFSARSVLALEKIEVTTVDPQADGYGTFQSHNQKVVSNKYGIFMTYLKSRTQSFTNNTWRLARSTDGGESFSIIYESADTIEVPVLETDPYGNLYIIYQGPTEATLVRFIPDDNFTRPYFVSNFQTGWSEKDTMLLDWTRQRIYYVSYPGRNLLLNILTLDGSVIQSNVILSAGSGGSPSYPNLYLDEHNDLYLAWTNDSLNYKPGMGYPYWSVHFMLSKDGGNTWQKPNGTILQTPIISDETGPTDRITLDDEFTPSTFLASFIVKNNKAHFVYESYMCCGFTNTAFTPRVHYVRYDLNSAKKDLDIYPEFKGDSFSIYGMDGHFESRIKQSGFPLYYISRGRDDHLGVVESFDNGQTWHDYALSDFNNQNAYSVGGAREVNSDGYIIGSYVDPNANNAVRFYKIKILPPQSSILIDNVLNMNNTVTVSYSNFVAHPTDWIGIFPVGATHNGWKDWKWVVDSSGTITLTAPSSGNYEVRYYTRDYSQPTNWKLLDSKTINIKANMDDYNLLMSSGTINIYDFNKLISNFGK